jgi:hypothetical protein
MASMLPVLPDAEVTKKENETADHREPEKHV